MRYTKLFFTLSVSEVDTAMKDITEEELNLLKLKEAFEVGLIQNAALRSFGKRNGVEYIDDKKEGDDHKSPFDRILTM